MHRVFLSLGSNIRPEVNLGKAIDLLHGRGRVLALSSAWQSPPTAGEGPDFLNACALLSTGIPPHRLKEELIQPIETALGRIRSADKHAPRTIDIDILMVDDEPANLDRWAQAYVVIPMSELAPDLEHPLEHRNLSVVAREARIRTRIEPRPDVLNRKTGG